MNKHTPKPWRAGRKGTVVCGTPIPEVNSSEHVDYYGGHLVCESVAEKNVPLISAAPEMKALIESVYDGIHRGKGKFASASDGELADAINDEMCNLLGNDWHSNVHNEGVGDE